MKRTWLVWLIFAISLSVVLAAMGWISLIALRQESAEARAQADSELEEDVRLALWRMHPYLISIVSQEASRPYFNYASGPPANAPQASPPAPDLNHVLLRFQISKDGKMISSEATTLPAAEKPRSNASMHDEAAVAGEQLAQLREFVTWEVLEEKTPNRLSSTSQPFFIASDQETPPNLLLVPGNRSRRASPQQTALSNVEFNARRQSYQKIGQGNQFIGTPQPGKVRVGAMQPAWIGEQLLLVRFVSEGEKEYRQGVWLDWPFMRDELLASVHDKFPHAKLRPVEDDPHISGERRLAVVPLEFLPGRTFITQTEPWSPLRTSLATAWSCVLLAALAVAALLLGVMRLSERRAAFVSAVTHELRTPLTTFRMYSEMLSAGMVAEDQRQEYLDTLRRESNRLSHLVENVLSYAKLERGRPRRRLSAVPVAELLAQAAPRLHERAEQAGMRMQIDVDEDAATVAALCDPSVVEQILFNLVDNACKYASNDLPAVIRIQAQCCGKRLSIYVRDQGPGIPADERRRLFQPFSKSASDAAHSKPGVGLGLALGRRLARAMGGDLRLEDCVGGGAFVLILRCAS